MKSDDKEHILPTKGKADATLLVEYAESRAKDALKWYKVMWSQYLWLTGAGWCLSALIPFGLAFVSFCKDEHTRDIVNILVLVISALAFCALVFGSVFRFRERAQAKMKMSNILDSAAMQYRCGLIDCEQVRIMIESAMKIEEEEIAP